MESQTFYQNEILYWSNNSNVKDRYIDYTAIVRYISTKESIDSETPMMSLSTLS